MRVAVTGATGRLGRALLAAFPRRRGSVEALAWSRPDYDLDAPAGVERLLDRDRPDLVVHAAAWTDVDGCAREPALAMARNGEAVDRLARACVGRGVDLVLVSTNEVFDGWRTDGRGYRVDDPPRPLNPYGASKLAGELAALRAYGIPTPWESAPPGVPGSVPSGRPRCRIVRTAWLFGPPGGDFPSKIVAAARAAAVEKRPLRVVADEIGSPTYTLDLAEAIVRLIEIEWEVGEPADRAGSGVEASPAAARDVHGRGPIWHLVNAGRVSRADWARETLRLVGLDVPVVDIPLAAWPRPSTPPRWAVLDPGELPPELVMRPWTDALAEYLGGAATEGRPI